MLNGEGLCHYSTQQVKNCDLDQQCVTTGPSRLRTVTSTNSVSLLYASPAPRPISPPVFDRILYAKTEGEGLGEKVTCMTLGRCEGRHERGAVTDRCNSQTLR